MTPYAPTERARSPRARTHCVHRRRSRSRPGGLCRARPARRRTRSRPAAPRSSSRSAPRAAARARTSAAPPASASRSAPPTRRSWRARSRLQDSSGTVLRTSGLNTGGAWLDMVTLPADDTYSIVVDASGTHTGSTTRHALQRACRPDRCAHLGQPGHAHDHDPRPERLVHVQRHRRLEPEPAARRTSRRRS